jgi:hypothetical protein
MPRKDLVGLLFGAPAEALPAALKVSSAGSWEDALRAAQNWNAAPQLAARIQELGCQPPEVPWREFKRALISTFARSASRASKGAAALRHLEHSGIPAVAFKGLASMARLYPTPANRTIVDADVLVEPERVPAAVACLAELGFSSAESHDLERWDRFLDRSPGFSGNKAINLYGPGGMEIDLHWSVGLAGLTPATLLERSEMATLFSCPVRVVSPADGLILTARHAIRENLLVDSICRDLHDIRLSCAFLAARRSLEPALREIAAATSPVPLLALTGILNTLNPVTAEGGDKHVQEAARILGNLASAKQKQSAQRLQALFFHQVEAGPIGPDLLYLSHSRPVRQILAGAFSNWPEYRKFMRSMETQLNGEEVPLSRRLWRLAKSLKTAGPAHWRGVRTLAQQKYEA